jgi:hypothetical protein
MTEAKQRLPHPDKPGFAMTENISPSPYPLPSRARDMEKISPQKGEEILEESSLEGETVSEKSSLKGEEI